MHSCPKIINTLFCFFPRLSYTHVFYKKTRTFQKIKKNVIESNFEIAILSTAYSSVTFKTTIE